jgi:hypothetical protein
VETKTQEVARRRFTVHDYHRMAEAGNSTSRRREAVSGEPRKLSSLLLGKQRPIHSSWVAVPPVAQSLGTALVVTPGQLLNPVARIAGGLHDLAGKFPLRE